VGLHIAGGRVVIAAELDAGALARRLRMALGEIYGYPCDVHVRTSAGLRTEARYLVRVVTDGPALARRTGLIDARGLPVGCPGPEAAMGLVGAARRLGITAKAREVRGEHRVIVRDGAAIGVLLGTMGAPGVRASWQERRVRRRDLRGTGNRLATFDDANLRRTADAADAPHG